MKYSNINLDSLLFKKIVNDKYNPESPKQPERFSTDGIMHCMYEMGWRVPANSGEEFDNRFLETGRKIGNEVKYLTRFII